MADSGYQQLEQTGHLTRPVSSYIWLACRGSLRWRSICACAARQVSSLTMLGHWPLGRASTSSAAAPPLPMRAT